MSLPSSVNYGEPLTTLPPETQNYSVAMTAVNGSKFDPSSQILVDLGSRGLLDPASLSIRYRITYTVATSGDVIKLVGTPVYTPILRLDTLINSQTVETINNYNTVANMWTYLSMSIADKMGVQYPLGYSNDLTNKKLTVLL